MPSAEQVAHKHATLGGVGEWSGVEWSGVEWSGVNEWVGWVSVVGFEGIWRTTHRDHEEPLRFEWMVRVRVEDADDEHPKGIVSNRQELEIYKGE